MHPVVLLWQLTIVAMEQTQATEFLRNKSLGSRFPQAHRIRTSRRLTRTCHRPNLTTRYRRRIVMTRHLTPTRRLRIRTIHAKYANFRRVDMRDSKAAQLLSLIVRRHNREMIGRIACPRAIQRTFLAFA